MVKEVVPWKILLRQGKLGNHGKNLLFRWWPTVARSIQVNKTVITSNFGAPKEMMVAGDR